MLNKVTNNQNSAAVDNRTLLNKIYNYISIVESKPWDIPLSTLHYIFALALWQVIPCSRHKCKFNGGIFLLELKGLTKTSLSKIFTLHMPSQKLLFLIS